MKVVVFDELAPAPTEEMERLAEIMRERQRARITEAARKALVLGRDYQRSPYWTKFGG